MKDKYFDINTLRTLDIWGYEITDFIVIDNDKDFSKADEIKNVIESKIDVDDISNIFLEKNGYIYQLVSPHRGNNYKWSLGRNKTATFDKWSNCEETWDYITQNALLHRLIMLEDIERRREL